MSYQPPILQVIKAPVNLVITVVNCYIFYYLNSRNVPVQDVAAHSESILVRKQYWRVVTATFSHYSFLHLIMNISTAYNLGYLERLLGVSRFLIWITILTIFPSIIDAIIRRKFFPDTEVYAVGYSCVLFGLQTIIAAYQSEMSIFGLMIPWSWAPFMELIVISILVPNASFIGHLSGIIIGYFIRWHFFDWITPQLFWNLLPWIVILFLINYKKSFPDRLKFFSMSKTPDATIQNGNIIRTA